MRGETIANRKKAIHDVKTIPQNVLFASSFLFIISPIAKKNKRIKGKPRKSALCQGFLASTKRLSMGGLILSAISPVKRRISELSDRNGSSQKPASKTPNIPPRKSPNVFTRSICIHSSSSFHHLTIKEKKM